MDTSTTSPSYCALYIPNENEFYTNETAISYFKTYITNLLNHVNVYTGIAYKSDPAVLAWETGNELDSPAQWTQMISQ